MNPPTLSEQSKTFLISEARDNWFELSRVRTLRNPEQVLGTIVVYANRTGGFAGMDPETLKQWLSSYGRAWMARDPEAAASLYTEAATYQVTPFDEPLRGRAAIYEYWTGIAKTEERIQFNSEILAVTADYGIARWRASFFRVPPGLETKLDGIFLISLDSAGRCQSLRE